ncbi:MAG: thiamine phosphate synthase, partial [Chloroflexi bacterium]|nr:thiamine phosphate synthase [Chloroflexota bacterium]
MLQIALGLKKVCGQMQALLVINDCVDVALACGADGVHLGQDDLPVAVARRLLPVDSIVGCSVTATSQAVRAQRDGADYLAVGAVYPTLSKEKVKLVGPAKLRQVRARVSLPLIAIGGINRDNVAEVVRAGASGVAVISAVMGAEDVEAAARDLLTKVQQSSLAECEKDG